MRADHDARQSHASEQFEVFRESIASVGNDHCTCKDRRRNREAAQAKLGREFQRWQYRPHGDTRKWSELRGNDDTRARGATYRATQVDVEDVARAFHVPLFKLGGTVPIGNTIEALQQTYYNDCLQALIESAESCLDEGLGLPADFHTEFDLDGFSAWTPPR